jgi:hypothetical protein
VSLSGSLLSLFNCTLDLGDDSARVVAEKPEMAIEKAHSSVPLRACNTTRPSCTSTLEACGGIGVGVVVVVVIITSSIEACLECQIRT